MFLRCYIQILMQKLRKAIRLSSDMTLKTIGVNKQTLNKYSDKTKETTDEP